MSAVRDGAHASASVWGISRWFARIIPDSCSVQPWGRTSRPYTIVGGFGPWRQCSHSGISGGSLLSRCFGGPRADDVRPIILKRGTPDARCGACHSLLDVGTALRVAQTPISPAADSSSSAERGTAGRHAGSAAEDRTSHLSARRRATRTHALATRRRDLGYAGGRTLRRSGMAHRRRFRGSAPRARPATPLRVPDRAVPSRRRSIGSSAWRSVHIAPALSRAVLPADPRRPARTRAIGSRERIRRRG